MSRSIVRYNMDKIAELKAQYNIIWGKKSNGKSYQLKHKRAVIKFLKTGRRFILMRRVEADISSAWVEQYFRDVDIAGLTDNKYNAVELYRGRIYLVSIDENFKKTKGDYMGYAVPLSLEQRYSSGSFLDVDDIIYEEFMSRMAYIKNEPSKLETFYNTVDRQEQRVSLWLIGNTVSRVCPYLEEWGLTQVMKNQKKGTIKLLERDNSGTKVKIAIEFCEDSGGKNTAIGNASGMINDGEWQTDPQPHLPKSYKNYECLFRMMFYYKGFKFCSEYIKDKKTLETCWFIYPYNGEIKKYTVVFSDIIKVNKYWQRDIYNPLIDNNNLKELFLTFKESNIFYASDMAGTDFKQVIDFTIRK